MNSNSIKNRVEGSTRRTPATPACTLMALVVGASLLVPVAANAATFNVTSNANAGAGSLRNAINQANASAADDIITFDPAVNNIVLTAALPVLGQGPIVNGASAATGSLSINPNPTPAPGAAQTNANLVTVSGNNAVRVFEVASGASVAMNFLQIRQGSTNGEGGAGILNKGNLALTVCFVSSNAATNTLAAPNNNIAVNGAGISNAGGTLSLVDSTVDSNTIAGTGPALGGGIFNGDGSTATLTRSTVSNNIISGSNFNGDGNQGGGIYNAGTLSLSNSTVAQNRAQGNAANVTVINRGGGIANVRGSAAITSSTIALNTIAGDSTGAGIFSATTLTLNNTIVAGNNNQTNNGPGAPVPPVTPVESNVNGAFSGNFNITTGTATEAGLAGALGGNGGFTQTVALNVTNNNPATPTVNANPAINAGDPSIGGVGATDQRGVNFPRVIGGRIDIGAFEANQAPPVTSNVSVNNVANVTPATPTNVTLTATDPDGDGVTFTIVTPPTKGTLSALQTTPTTNGPAGTPLTSTQTIQYTPNANAAGPDTFTYQATDTKGLKSNISTVTLNLNERNSLIVTTTSDVVNPNDGVTSLREAVNFANSDGVDSVITFSPTVFGTAQGINLVGQAGGSTQLNLITSGTITITGPAAGVIISGSNAGRVFQNTANNATLNNLTITGGNQSSAGAGNNVGGGILNLGTLTINNLTVSGNSAAEAGGGIANGGTLTINRSTISNNRALTNFGYGGGIFNNTGATVTISTSTFSGNQGRNGGAIGSFTPLTVNASTFSGNSAVGNLAPAGATPGAGDGGAIFTTGAGSGITLTNATFSGNTAGRNGGAVAASGPLTILSSTIVGNTANGAGGGIDNTAGSLNLSNSIIVGNTGATSPNFSNPVVSGTNNITTGTAMDAGLDPAGLKDNGGNVQTIALTTRGTAVNKGDNAASAALTTDGRGPGFPRVVGPRIDIGAFESAFGNRAPQANNETFSTSINVPFSQQIFATDDDNDTLSFAKSGGTLPNGVTISSTGLISGTPTEAGRFDFQVNIFDGSNVTVAKFILIVSTNADGVGPVVTGPDFNDTYTRDQLASIVYLGTVTDVAPTGVTPSGVASVLFQLRRDSDGFAYSGDPTTGFTSNKDIGYFPAFIFDPVPNTTAGTSNFRRTFSSFIPPTLTPGSYSIVIAAKDKAGNFSVEVSTINIVAAPGAATAPSAAKAKTSGGAS